MSRPASDIRERIIVAARHCFLFHGVEGASLRAIAREASTNIGMVYYYFASKDELFFATLEEYYAPLLADLQVIVESSGDFRAKVERIYARVGTMHTAEFDTLRMVVREALISNERFRQLIARFSCGHLSLVYQLISQGVSEGNLRSDLPIPLLMVTMGATGVMPQLAARLLQEHTDASAAIFPESFALSQASRDLYFDGAATVPPPSDFKLGF